MGNAGTTPSYLFNHAFPLTSAESPFYNLAGPSIANRQVSS